MLIYPLLITEEVLFQHLKIPDDKIVEDMASLKQEVILAVEILDTIHALLCSPITPDMMDTLVKQRGEMKGAILQKLALYVFLEKLSVARQTMRN